MGCGYGEGNCAQFPMGRWPRWEPKPGGAGPCACPVRGVAMSPARCRRPLRTRCSHSIPEVRAAELGRWPGHVQEAHPEGNVNKHLLHPRALFRLCLSGGGTGVPGDVMGVAWD